MPESQADKAQPVDAGFGVQMKLKIGSSLNKWLENEENLEKWHDKMSAKERRILMTEWTGKTLDDKSKRKDFIRRSFAKTGCLRLIASLATAHSYCA